LGWREEYLRLELERRREQSAPSSSPEVQLLKVQLSQVAAQQAEPQEPQFAVRLPSSRNSELQ
jgi:hypothetical protein